MNRHALLVAVTFLALVVECRSTPQHGPAPCQAISPPPQDPALPTGTVWGFADLHAHPAIERAFSGKLIWGSAIDGAPVDATELPVIDSCPVETHDHDASSPVDRAVGTLVYPQVAAVAHFAHAPVGAVEPTDAWPNARDVIHQQMNVASIRRAYEGGLRLMFASTTDSQIIAQLLNGPDFVNGFVPDPEADFQSAKSQIELIQQIVEQNSNWMWVARSPREARDIIGGGRLAVVISLEMDGLREADLDTLVRDYRVRHIIPVHLIDNDVGGTAANSDLFNAASAEVSEIYRSDKEPMRYLDVVPTTSFSRALGWPDQIVTGPSAPLYVNIQSVPYLWYSQLCYEPLAACSGTAPALSSFIEFGQENLRGLCSTAADCTLSPHPGMARVSRMMDLQPAGDGELSKLFIDVSHMSDNSVLDTLGTTPTVTTAPPGGYPLIASHGDIAHLCDDAPAQPPCVDNYAGVGTERSLRSKYARQIVARQGVLGLGTGIAAYDTRTVIEARGGPLLTLTPAASTACVAVPGAGGVDTPACVPVPGINVPDPTATAGTLQVETLGGISGTGPNAHPFVRVELDGPNADQYQHRVIVQPLECSTGACAATVQLGNQDQASTPTTACDALSCQQENTCGQTPYTLDQIDSVTLEMLDLGCDLSCMEASGTVGQDLQCQNGGGGGSAPVWTIDEAELSVSSGGQPASTIVEMGPVEAAPVTELGQSRGTFALYQRGDRASANPGTHASGHLLRVSITSGKEQTVLQGAGIATEGANVCVAVRQAVDGVCVPSTPPAAGATECPEGWVSVNQRGTWTQGGMLYTFVRFAGAESSNLRGRRRRPRLGFLEPRLDHRRGEGRIHRGSRRALDSAVRRDQQIRGQWRHGDSRLRHGLQWRQRNDGHLGVRRSGRHDRGIILPGRRRPGDRRRRSSGAAAAGPHALPQRQRNAWKRGAHRGAWARHLRAPRRSGRHHRPVSRLRSRCARLADAVRRGHHPGVGGDGRSHRDAPPPLPTRAFACPPGPWTGP